MICMCGHASSFHTPGCTVLVPTGRAKDEKVECSCTYFCERE